jgi:hypothetical protein
MAGMMANHPLLAQHFQTAAGARPAGTERTEDFTARNVAAPALHPQPPAPGITNRPIPGAGGMHHMMGHLGARPHPGMGGGGGMLRGVARTMRPMGRR